jgi:hypothetical protein
MSKEKFLRYFENLEKVFHFYEYIFLTRKHGCVLAVPARPSSHKILVSQSHYREIEIVKYVFITAFTSWPQRGPESAESLKKVKYLIKSVMR